MVIMTEHVSADVHNRSRNRKQDRRLPSPLLQLNEDEDDVQKASTTKKQKFEVVDDEDLNHHRHHQRLSESLYKLCTDRLHLVESSEGKRKRRIVLRDLRDLLSTWSASLPVDDDDNEDDNDIVPPSSPSPALLSFGSYRLGVHSPDADVDCLVLASPHIRREDFFGSWVDMLNQKSTMRKDGNKVGGGRICNLHSIPNAYTPVIKFEMDGVKIDMIFASVNNRKLFAINRLHTKTEMKSEICMDSIDDDDDNDNNDIDYTDETMRIDDAMLAGLDESSVRSINGVRVAQFLLDTLTDGCAGDGCLPPPMREDATSCLQRLDKFRLTLRLVKAWARNHGLYANVLGFLGGVNWAILVCYICERHPNELPSKLLQIFFHTFANWNWRDPVSLSKQQNDPPLGVQPLPSWDPINIYRDSTHVMPIITPCYPSMNSSYNVGEPQLRRMRDEFLKASKVCDTIMNDISSSPISISCWDVLFEGNDFFKQHANYLQIDIIGTNEDEFRAWFGLCESRLRLLIVGLESKIDGVHAYPYAKFYHRKERRKMTDGNDTSKRLMYVTSHFIALRFAHTARRVDLGPLVMDFLQVVNSFEGRTSGMDLTMSLISRKDLPVFVLQPVD